MSDMWDENLWENPKFKKIKIEQKSSSMPIVFSNMQKGSDLWQTPKSAVEIILPFIQKFKNKIIWCPFDTKESQFVKVLKHNGFNVKFSHLGIQKDFFEYEPREWDVIISNPPWSIKDKILKRAYLFEKPFLLLLPIHSIGGKYRWSAFKDGKLELIIPKNRIEYTNPNYVGEHKRPPFESAFFCYKVLDKQIEYERE